MIRERGPGYFMANAPLRCYMVRMPRTAPGPTRADHTIDEARDLTDAARADLLASLEAGRADYAAGRYHVLKPGMLRKEFEAILDGDPTDEELDALLGIVPPKSP